MNIERSNSSPVSFNSSTKTSSIKKADIPRPEKQPGEPVAEKDLLDFVPYPLNVPPILAGKAFNAAKEFTKETANQTLKGFSQVVDYLQPPSLITGTKQGKKADKILQRANELKKTEEGN